MARFNAPRTDYESSCSQIHRILVHLEVVFDQGLGFQLYDVFSEWANVKQTNLRNRFRNNYIIDNTVIICFITRIVLPLTTYEKRRLITYLFRIFLLWSLTIVGLALDAINLYVFLVISLHILRLTWIISVLLSVDVMQHFVPRLNFFIALRTLLIGKHGPEKLMPFFHAIVVDIYIVFLSIVQPRLINNL